MNSTQIMLDSDTPLSNIITHDMPYWIASFLFVSQQ